MLYLVLRFNYLKGCNMSSGKCPSCKKLINYAKIEPFELRQGLQQKWKGVSYKCPDCDTIISVGMDPLALKADTAKETVAALRRG